MNSASRFRTAPDPARYLLIALLILIINISDPIRAQVGVDASQSTVASASSRQADSDCGLLRVPASPLKNARKALSQQWVEYTLGSKLAADVEQHSELITDDAVVKYMNRLEQTLTSRSHLSGCFIVKVLSDPEPNAYSFPGGFIYVTTGLLDLTENEGQLVAALAHETAHVTARHLTRLDTQARIWRRLALVAGPAGYALRRYLSPLLITKVVRNKEFAADRLGLRYAMASGYDPFEFSRLLQIAFSQEEEKEPFLNRLYDTHPSTNTRIERLQRATRLWITPDTSYVVSTVDFVQMRMHLSKVMAAREQR